MKTLWLGRDTTEYHLGRHKKYWVEYTPDGPFEFWYFTEGHLLSFCANRFESLTNIKLQPGELVKVKITPLKDGFLFEVEKG